MPERAPLPRARRPLSALALSALCAASACKKPAPITHPTAAEAAMRSKLGVPADAARVIVFGQNAHLDIDWQNTFDGYYSGYVEDIFTAANQLLQSQPRAYYSVAEMAYLQHHLKVHPEQVAAFQAASARGALRIVGGGMTSPDTLLPEAELLFRDSLYGIQFAEDWLGQSPRAAWLPDSFGHSGTAPDLLAAAGYKSVAFSRIDGAPTLFEELLYPDRGARPGSNALLLQQLGSADFSWRGAGGATVLGHFMPGFGLYCQGDNLDYDEDLQKPGAHTGPFRGDDPSFTDARIDQYAAELQPYAKTPYLFVPVGCDFQSPKAELLGYLDGYNQRRYPSTHLWAAAAPFDDYAELVSSWSEALPELSGDLSPYYMGFYGSRADLKRGARDAAAPFFVAESFAAALGEEGRELVLAAAPALQLLTRANHHDFITGTAADPVVANEQLPLLANAKAAGEEELAAVARALASRIPATPGASLRLLALNASSATRSEVAEVQLPLDGGAAPELRAVIDGAEVPLEVLPPLAGATSATLRLALSEIPPFSWRTIDLLPGAPAAPAPAVALQLSDASGAPTAAAQATRAVLSNARVRAQFDDDGTGFALSSLRIDGAEALAGRSLLVHDAHDQGGLWRLGNEMPGCALTELADPAGARAVQVLESTPWMVHISFQSPTETREAWLGAGASGLSLAITTGAAVAATRTVSFSLAAAADAPLVTSSPGGSLVRPAERIYSPTYWPAVGWAAVGGWAVLLRQSTGVRMSAPGQLVLMAARNAQSEACDIEGGTGSDPGTHRVEWRLERAESVAQAEILSQAFNRPLALVAEPQLTRAITDLPRAQSLAQLSGAGLISALKPAERGSGVILRVLLEPGPATVRLSPLLGGAEVEQVDLAERDLAHLGNAGLEVKFDRKSAGAIASVRLH